jgi:hypothetical protein
VAVFATSQGEFRPSASTVGVSFCHAVAQCDYFGAGAASAVTAPTAVGLRSVRARGHRSAPVALLAALETHVWLVAAALRVTAAARVEGTTGYFGRGDAAGGAIPGAAPQHIKPAFGAATAAASGHAAAHLACLGSGYATNETRFLADPYFVRGGVKYHDGLAPAVATAWGMAEPYIYSICLSVGRALPEADAARWMPAVARVTARASGTARWELVVPVATEPAVLHSHAEGAAVARLAAIGRGQVLAASLVNAPGRALRNARGAVAPISEVRASAAVFLVRGVLRAVASALGRGGRVLLAGGGAQASAAVSGFNQVNDLVRAPRDRTLTVGASDRTALVTSQTRTVAVAAQSRQLAA